VTTGLQLVDPMVDHRIPEKFKALYVLIFIHVKMTLEELVQQLEALFLAIHSAYSDVAFSNTLSTIMVQWIGCNWSSSKRIISFKVIVH